MEFKEYMIKKEKSAKEKLLSVLCYLAAAVLSMIILPFSATPPFGSFILLIVVGLFYFAHILSGRLNKEFEYIFTADNIDIDVIMNKSKRKRLITFTIAQIEIMASFRDATYNSIAKGQFDKVVDATSGKADANVYFVVVDKNGRTLVKFEPNYSVVESLNKVARSKVHIYE